MFLLVATALAGTVVGWPCQRLNWGWRNVWSTCSINSFAPAASAEVPLNIPNHFRVTAAAATPTSVLATTGVYTPGTSAAIPQFFCANAAATGSGATSFLRNRCRRAVDAYGSLVRQCQLPPLTAGARGPSAPSTNLAPDFAPVAAHHPHSLNVQALTHASGFCTLPVGTPVAPGNLPTPSTTCPGLLGWFTVVFNACGFTNAPGLTPTLQAAPATQPNIHNYFPFGGTTTVAGVLTSPNPGPTRVGIFCSPDTAPSTPQSWNQNGAVFRTSRCRKALDQFGRTANRCHASISTTTGPAQAGGFSDPLRILAVGTATNQAVASPNGINMWAPLCNV